MWQMLISPITDLIGKVIDKAVPDAGKRERLKAQIRLELLAQDGKTIEQAANVIMAEAHGESWLQRNWRPILMPWFAGLVGAYWLGYTAPNLPESTVNELLSIIKVGLGGYVIGRSVEKTAKIAGQAAAKWKSE